MISGHINGNRNNRYIVIKTVSYEFTVDNTDPAADFYISMGKVKEETPASVITLSNISVVKTK